MTYCHYCDRVIIHTSVGWIDPAAHGDDAVWRETCGDNDTFAAEHAPTCPTCGSLNPGYWCSHD